MRCAWSIFSGFGRFACRCPGRSSWPLITRVGRSRRLCALDDSCSLLLHRLDSRCPGRSKSADHLPGLANSGRLCASLVAMLQAACAPSIPAAEVYQLHRLDQVACAGRRFRPLVRIHVYQVGRFDSRCPGRSSWPLITRVGRSRRLCAVCA